MSFLSLIEAVKICSKDNIILILKYKCVESLSFLSLSHIMSS
jgi:hypothetical protein